MKGMREKPECLEILNWDTFLDGNADLLFGIGIFFILTHRRGADPLFETFLVNVFYAKPRVCGVFSQGISNFPA